MLAQNGDQWRPGKDTLAGILEQQLPILERVTQPGAAPDFVAVNEEHVGEPLSNFLPYMERSTILVPDELSSTGIASGILLLHLRVRVRVEKLAGVTAVVR